MYDKEDIIIDMAFIENVLLYREEQAQYAQAGKQIDVYDLEVDMDKLIWKLHNILKYIIPDEERKTSDNPSEAERSEESKE